MLSIMSQDEVGIVSGVAQAIGALHGNISDLRQSVLCGYFSMILLVEFAEAISAETLQRALQAPRRQITIQPVIDLPTITQPAASYILTASGADHIGFVAAVSNFCAQHRINIIDLATTSDRGDYVMMLQLDLTHAAPLVDIRYQLRRFSEQNGIRTVLQHQDIFTATNEIS